MYETLRTRFVRNPDWVARLDDRLKRPNVAFIDDRDYRDKVYSATVDFSIRHRRPFSMVDMLCRMLIDDPDVHIDILLTLNAKDFHDVCQRRGVEMFDHEPPKLSKRK